MISLLSFFAISASLLVVTATSTIMSIIWLVAVFVSTALILGILGISYAALTYILVYVGAIAILFLFVVQLLDQRNLNLNNNESVLNFSPPSFFLLSLAQKQGEGSKEKEGTSSSFGGEILKNSYPLIFLFGVILLLEISQLLPVMNEVYIPLNPFISLINNKVGLNISHLFTSSTSNLNHIFSSGFLTSEQHIITQEVGLSTILAKSSSLQENALVGSTYLGGDSFIGSSGSFGIDWSILPAVSQGDMPINSNYTDYHCSDTLLLKGVGQEIYLNNFYQIINLGEWLYGSASIALFIISLILLLAMVGPIILCWRTI